MSKVLVFGNSGSGKSTLAKKLCAAGALAHLDLDNIAWQVKSPTSRKPLIESAKEMDQFISSNRGWVIEGCYADLLNIAVPQSDEIIFMNLTVETCIENAKHRPWEAHKYASKEAQDKNLGMLIDWIAQYASRTDTFSEAAHTALYEQYAGKKRMITSNESSL